MIRRCGFWSDTGGDCPSTSNVRYFLVGWRCPNHTPARLAGRDDLIPDPDRDLDALRRKSGRIPSFNPNDTALNDQRAITSGRRRSTPEQFRAAQAAEAERKAAR